MKKYIKLLIVVILLCLISILIYKFAFNKETKSKSQDFTDLKKYIYDIYGKNFIIPEFDDINNAPDLWTWEVVKNNLENYESTYEEIMQMKNGFGKI